MPDEKRDPVPPTSPRMTVPHFRGAKSRGERLVVLTAYDYPTARIFDRNGVDALLVGDTLGMVVQGGSDTLTVTMDQMVYHVRMVSRAAERALVIGDLPFLSYQVDDRDAIRNAGRLLQEGGAHAVKLEGGRRSESTIRAITRAQIPVMGHIGLTPQSILHLGRYKAQRDERQILDDAKAVEDAGAFSVVLETIPIDLAQKVSASISIPTIGIGAGPHCDGQVLVWQDAFGLTEGHLPRYVKRYADLQRLFTDAVRAYSDEVRRGAFPDADHAYR